MRCERRQYGVPPHEVSVTLEVMSSFYALQLCVSTSPGYLVGPARVFACSGSAQLWRFPHPSFLRFSLFMLSFLLIMLRLD